MNEACRAVRGWDGALGGVKRVPDGVAVSKQRQDGLPGDVGRARGSGSAGTGRETDKGQGGESRMSASRDSPLQQRIEEGDAMGSPE